MIVALISVLAAAAIATPVDRASWFKADDYPLEAMTKRMEGSVTFEVDVDTDGKPLKCRVMKSSGQPILDQRTCDVVLSRAHFNPALDGNGKPIPGSYSTNTVWRLAGDATAASAAALATTDASNEKMQAARTLFSEDDYPVEAVKNGWEGVVVADLTVSPEGRVRDCTVFQSSGHAVLDGATCDILTKRAIFKPATDANGKPVEDHVRTPPIKWALSTSGASLPKGWKASPGYFLCSEPAGAADVYGIPPLELGKPVKFRFRLMSENYDPNSSVNAALLFETASGEMRFRVGKAEDHSQHLFVTLHGAGEAPDEWVWMEPWLPPTEWVDVKMELNPSGVVRIVTENTSGSIPLGTTQPVQTLLQCSSGVFEVQMSPTSSVLHALRP